MANTRLRARGFLAGAGVIGALALGGCSKFKVSGAVLRGEIGRAFLVSPTDPRLEEPGIPGVEIEVSSDGSGRGRHVLATVVSDETGRFQFAVPMPAPPRLAIRATKEGEYDVRTTVDRPTGGEQMMVLMRPPRAP